MTLDNAVDLVAKYRDWFGDYTNFQVVGSRIDRVGERLGIFYRFLLQNREDWYTIEQQLYCTLKDGRVERLHLLCSGFQPVETNNQAAPVDAPETREQDPVRDELLEFHIGAVEHRFDLRPFDPGDQVKTARDAKRAGVGSARGRPNCQG